MLGGMGTGLGCRRVLMLAAQELLVMSATVSVVEQKRGALSMYPLGVLRWKPIRGSASVGSSGMTKASAG
eukprot:6696986-Ditylum_brightwellii.AAC.1